MVAQEKEQIDVNFISRNNINNNARRSNFGNNNPRPFPSNNSYGNSYNNTYPSTKSSTFELESMLKEFITSQKAFNKNIEEKLGSLSLKVDNIAHDVEKVKPLNTIQVQINENIRMLAKLKDRWAREKEV